MTETLYLLYAVGALVVLTLVVVSRREGSRIPSFAAMAGFVMAYRVGRVPVGRIAMLGFWWWVGWHFFAR
jgi:hypothetical protein